MKKKNLVAAIVLAVLVSILLYVILNQNTARIEKPVDTERVTIFSNGTIYLDSERKVSSLLVKDGFVSGFDVDVLLYPNAEVIDLNGSFVYPGFSDSHVHLLETGYVLLVGVNLIGCDNVEQIVEKLSEKSKTVPEGGMILGVGFSLHDYDKWSLSDLEKIDAATGAHPTFLGDKLGHNAIVNTAAMNLAGLSPETKVPLGGKMGIENGKLTGMLRESALILPWNKLSGLFSSADLKSGTKRMADLWSSMGYTSVVDLMGGPGARMMNPEVFWDLEKEGNLPLRVNYCYTIFNLNDVNEAAKYIGKDSELVRFVGGKIFVDGAFAGGQAWTSWANEQGNNGLREIYTDDTGGPELNLNRIVAKVEEYGMNMHYHAQGDKAIDAVLNALDNVRKEKGEIKGIHTIIHLAFVTDKQIERIKGFNGHAVVTTQPGFWAVESDTAYYYGKKAAESYPIKKMFDNNISVGISTDFSVSPLDYSYPTAVIGIALTGGGLEGPIPLSIKQTFDGFTVGSAKTTGKNDVGTLDIGKKADLVVFNKDLFSMSPKDFSKTNPKVLSTFINGKQCFKTKEN